MDGKDDGGKGENITLLDNHFVCFNMLFDFDWVCFLPVVYSNVCWFGWLVGWLLLSCLSVLSRFGFWLLLMFGWLLFDFVLTSKKRVGAIRDVEVAKAMIAVAHKKEPGFLRLKPGKMVEIAYG